MASAAARAAQHVLGKLDGRARGAAALRPGQQGIEALEDRRLLAATLVRDLNPTTPGADPGPIAVVRPTAYYSTAHITTSNTGGGVDVWRTDGTAAGTALVAWQASATDGPLTLVPSGQGLYYVARGTDNQRRRAVFRLDVATGASVPLTTRTFDGALDQLTALAGKVFYRDNPGTGYDELWATDGTAAGTARVAGPTAFRSGTLKNLVAANGLLYFSADDGVHGAELWQSDGTAAGTRMVVDANPGAAGSAPGPVTASGGAAYFAASDATAGAELWRTDGTPAGTARVADVGPGVAGSAPASLADVNGTLYFAADDGVHGSELWRTDGTAAGTALVADAVPGAAGSAPTNLVGLGSGVLYSATGPAGAEPWRSDGTAAGTVQLADVRPGATGSSPAKFVASGSLAYFVADDGTTGPELWRTDGTAAGTYRALDVRPGAAGSSPAGLVAFGGGVLFAADDGTHGTEVWRSDGTTAGTALVRDVNAKVQYANPMAVAALGGRAVFAVTSGPNTGVWITDGTDVGTIQLTAATRISTSGYYGFNDYGQPTYLVVGGVLYWSGTGGLWRTDGTPGGTYLLKAIAGNTPSQPSYVTDLTDVGGRLYFSATGPTSGDELWTSDGTPAGTYLVKDLSPGVETTNDPKNSSPRSIVDFGGFAYFRANRNELFRTDGSSSGTVPVNPGVTYAEASTLTPLNGRLYFAARASDGDPFSLWQSDGTAAGTVPLGGNIHPAAQTNKPFGVVFDGGLYFNGTDAGGATGVWRLDPGSGVPVRVGSQLMDNPTVVRDKLYFNSGYQLWVMPAGGQQSLVRAFPNSGSYVRGLTNVAGTLYFVAADTGTGDEVWRSDGTAAGTSLVADLAVGPGGSAPGFLTAVGDSLFFAANGTDVGNELYWVPQPATLPAAPAGLTAAAANGQQIDLAWADVADNETGYWLERSTSPTFETVDATAALAANATRYAATGLAPGRTYYFRLRAVTAAGASAAATASAVTPAAPLPPSGLTLSIFSYQRIDLTWADGSTDETGFRIERSLYKSFAAIDRSFTVGPHDGPVAAAADTGGVVKQTTYYYRVVAFNAAGDSAPAVASVTIPNLPPIAPTALAVRVATSEAAPYQVFVSWTNVADNATGVVVERRDLSTNATKTVGTVSALTTGYLDTVPAGGRYAYRVRALNEVGQSPPSNEAVAVADPLAYRVAEIHPGDGSYPTSLTAFGDFVYFAADDGIHGTELWRSDGTAAGTSLVADVNPQGAGSNPSGLVVADGVLYFQATDGSGTRQTWRTDGTAAGTVPAPGATPPAPGVQPGTSSAPPTVGPLKYYLADNALWRTDGTPDGTVRLISAGDPATTGYTVVGGSVYFNFGTQLYRTDGTANGTRFVLQVDNRFRPGTPFLDRAVVNGTVFFAAEDWPTGNRELYAVAPAAPAAPDQVTAAAVGASIRVRWRDNAGSASGFRVERSRSPEFTTVDATLFAPAGATELYDAGYSAGVTNYYRVRAFTGAGDSANSAVAAAAAPASPAAVLLGFDDGNAGTWTGLYGGVGAYPVRVTDPAVGSTPLTPTGTTNLVWAATTTDPRALQTASGSTARAAIAWAADTSFTVAVATPAGSARNLSLYMVDWDAAGRSQQVDLLDPATGAVLATQAVSDFAAGRWVVFNVLGPVVVRVTRLAGPNAVLSGVFVDAAQGIGPPPATTNFYVSGGQGGVGVSFANTAGPGGQYAVERSTDGVNFTRIGVAARGVGAGASYADTTTLPRVYYWYRVRPFNALGSAPATASAAAVPDAPRMDRAAAFAGLDSTHRGNWLGTYGGELSQLANGSAQANYLSGNDGVLWAASTTDPRALEYGDGSGRRAAAAWSSPTSFTITPSYRDFARTLTLYAVDWDDAGRSERVDLLDGYSGAVLDSRTITGFRDGVYLRWNTKGYIKVVVTRLSGPDAVVSGLFFDQLHAPNAPAGVTATGGPGRVDLAWRDFANDEEGFRIERSTDAVRFSEIATAPADATSYADATAAPGTIYYYRVKAYNSLATTGNGWGEVTPVVRATALAVTDPRPTVQSVVVNGGVAQRSRVTGLTVTFDQPVALAAGTFALAGRNGVGTGVTVSALNPSGDGRTWELSFAGTGVVSGSLPDGVYDLRVVAASVRAGSPVGPAMAADATVTFHRLFGDQDGNRTVNNADYVRFRGSFGSSAGSTAYSVLFDYDGNGTINNSDYLQFRSRFGTAFNY